MPDANISCESRPLVASYWSTTAGQRRTYPTLREPAQCDVAIIGAGFTGLSAAYHLQRQGHDCIVLDAQQPGWGASGRNGGMAVPRYKATYPELAAKFGPDGALTLHAAAHDAVETLAGIVRDGAIECGFSRSGHMAPYVDARNASRFEADAAWLQSHAGDTAPRILGATETARRLGTSLYKGAYLEPRGCGIQPFAYCQGLAAALASRGVRLFGDSPVLGWRRTVDDIVVETAAAVVRCTSLVLATNGYSDLTRAGNGMKRRIVPVVSSVIVTAPLGADLATQILPNGELATDAKRLTNYFRRFDDNRLLFGGRGGASNRESEAIYARLMRDLARVYPQLRDVTCEYRWSGRVAVTLDNLPRIGSLERNVLFAMGYSGRGVALATYLGRMLADRICGAPLLPLPLASLPFPTIPFHSLRVPAKQAVILWYKLLDSVQS